MMQLDLTDVFYGKREMTLEEAKEVRNIKRTATYRYLAEACLPKDNCCHGNQMVGQDLCRSALKAPYPNDDIWMMYKPEEKFGDSFARDNKSLVGDFYWWE